MRFLLEARNLDLQEWILFYRVPTLNELDSAYSIEGVCVCVFGCRGVEDFVPRSFELHFMSRIHMHQKSSMRNWKNACEIFWNVLRQ